MNWLHKLFNPHCPHCKNDEEDGKICNNCEYLKMQIAKLQQENDKLLSKLIEPTESTRINESDEAPIPLNTSRFTPWIVKKRELEEADRKKARQIAEGLKQDHNRNIKSLEKEIFDAKVEPINIISNTGTIFAQEVNEILERSEAL